MYMIAPEYRHTEAFDIAEKRFHASAVGQDMLIRSGFGSSLFEIVLRRWKQHMDEVIRLGCV
jgi:hypothetical protein